MSELISKDAALDCFCDWIDRYGNEHTADEDATYQRIAELPVVQPVNMDETPVKNAPNSTSSGSGEGKHDLIDRQAAIDALARMMPRSYTPDGSHPADEEIFRAQEVFVDCIEALEILPSAQPEIIRCKDCKYRDENWRRVSVRWLPCMDVRTGSNWYCGSAERGEQDG